MIDHCFNDRTWTQKINTCVLVFIIVLIPANINTVVYNLLSARIISPISQSSQDFHPEMTDQIISL